MLCCMASLLCCSLGMRRHIPAKGEYVRRFGDRNDGRRVRSLSPIFAVSPYIMKTRNTSQNFLEDALEVTNLERYVLEKRQAGLEGFGMLHALLAAYVRTCAAYPGLNRFIAGQKIYTRDREIEVNMTIKKEMSVDSPDTVIKVTFDAADTAETVYRRFHEKVRQVKEAPEDTSFDALAGPFQSGAGPGSEGSGGAFAGGGLLRMAAALLDKAVSLPRVAVHHLHGLSGHSAHLPPSLRLRQRAGVLLHGPQAQSL